MFKHNESTAKKEKHMATVYLNEQELNNLKHKYLSGKIYRDHVNIQLEKDT